MSGVNPGKRPPVVRLQKYFEASSKMFGFSLMALAWHLGTQSSQAGNHGYSGSEQAGPAFAVLGVAAAAATIALASRAREPAERPREADPSGADQ
jgi:hypothetical protein